MAACGPRCEWRGTLKGCPNAESSPVGFDGNGVSVGVLEPCNAAAAGSQCDSEVVVVRFVVADELDARRPVMRSLGSRGACRALDGGER